MLSRTNVLRDSGRSFPFSASVLCSLTGVSASLWTKGGVISTQLLFASSTTSTTLLVFDLVTALTVGTVSGMGKFSNSYAFSSYNGCLVSPSQLALFVPGRWITL